MKMARIGNNNLWTTDPTLNCSDVYGPFKETSFFLSDTGNHCEVLNRDTFQFVFYKYYSICGQ